MQMVICKRCRFLNRLIYFTHFVVRLSCTITLILFICYTPLYGVIYYIAHAHNIYRSKLWYLQKRGLLQTCGNSNVKTMLINEVKASAVLAIQVYPTYIFNLVFINFSISKPCQLWLWCNNTAVFEIGWQRVQQGRTALFANFIKGWTKVCRVYESFHVNAYKVIDFFGWPNIISGYSRRCAWIYTFCLIGHKMRSHFGPLQLLRNVYRMLLWMHLLSLTRYDSCKYKIRVWLYK